MTDRVIVTLHLPLEIGTSAAVMKAVGREFPDATIQMVGSEARISADPDISIGERRRIAKERRG